MAVVKFGEIGASRVGDKDDKYKREYKRLFRAVTNSVYDGANTVLAHPSCPVLFSFYVNGSGTEIDVGSLLRSISARQSDPNSPRVWEVECNYSTDTADLSRSDPNPVARPADISAGFNRYTRALEKDIEGKEILNCAKKPFDPPPEFDDSRPVLTISKNELMFDFAIAALYQDAVNTDTFFGGAIGCWKVMSLKGDRQYENGAEFFRNTYEFEYRREGWQPALLSRGRSELIEGKPFSIMEKGVVIGDPILLDGGGHRLLPGPDRLTVLNGAIGAGVGVLTVKAKSGEAFVMNRTITIDNEDILPTGHTGAASVPSDVWQVTRGVNGTTAASHADGATVTQKTGATTKLTSAMAAADNYAEIYDGKVFGLAASTGRLIVEIENEQCLVVSVVPVGLGGVNFQLNLIRAYNGTTRAAHASGKIVQQAPTYLSFTAYKALPFAPLNLP